MCYPRTGGNSPWCCAPQLLTGLVAAGLQPATQLSRLENLMLNGEIEYLGCCSLGALMIRSGFTCSR
jgi:hypothetical protein